MHFWDYILTWRLPAALLLWGLAALPIRKAYRLLRIGDIWNRGAVNEIFLSSLLIGLAGAIYPFAIVGIIGIWYAMGRKHMLGRKEFLASLMAIATIAIYYGLVVYIKSRT